jgi:hypothetical protein
MDSDKYVKQGQTERENATKRKTNMAASEAKSRHEMLNNLAGGGGSSKSGCMTAVVVLAVGGLLVRWLLR